MRYKPFGKTGMDVSGVVMGTWGLDSARWGNTDTNEAAKAMLAMVDRGVNLIDTAPVYGRGVSEEIVGRTVKEAGIRDKVYIVTKGGVPFSPNLTKSRDASREGMTRGCEDSLRRLQTDYIDVLLVHWPDPDTPVEETATALMELKRQGKIRHIGVSNFSIEQMKEFRKYGDLEVLQPPFSMVDASSVEIMKWARGEGIACMTYGSIGAGILGGRIRELPKFEETDVRGRFYTFFNEPQFSQVMELLKAMDKVSAAHGGVPLSHIAINWVVQKDFVSAAIIGATQVKHAEENCAAMDFSLSDDELAFLDKEVARLISW